MKSCLKILSTGSAVGGDPEGPRYWRSRGRGGPFDHMADQGGPVQPRDRFTGGSFKTPEGLYGSLEAVDPTTGETKAVRKLDYRT
jgi:hypothetical protein